MSAYIDGGNVCVPFTCQSVNVDGVWKNRIQNKKAQPCQPHNGKTLLFDSNWTCNSQLKTILNDTEYTCLAPQYGPVECEQLGVCAVITNEHAGCTEYTEAMFDTVKVMVFASSCLEHPLISHLHNGMDKAITYKDKHGLNKACAAYADMCKMP
jgi:hypothetical protein